MDTKKRLIEIAEGTYVEHDVLNVVEKIRAYDPNLRVKFCDPQRAEFGDAPYKIVELCPDGIERIVFDVWALDDTVVQRIYAADNAKNNVLVDVDNNNLLAQKIQDRRYEEKRLESNDIVKHIFASNKGRYSFPREDGAIVHLDDDPNRSHRVVEPK